MTKPVHRPEAWERRTAETDPAWQAFVVYRDMGLERSLSKLAAHLGKSVPLVAGWSSKHQWVARVQLYDAMVDREYVAEVKAARRRAARRNAALAQKVLTRLDSIVDEGLTLKIIDAGELARLADTFTKIEREALGVPDRVEVTAGGSTAGKSGAALPDEDRRTRLLALQREIGSRLSDVAVLEPEAAPVLDDEFAED